MDALHHNPIMAFRPDTLEHVRRLHGLAAPGQMEAAVDGLAHWAAKQEHFTVKSFPRGFLERVIINNKGSLEAAKRKLDKACTFRTVLPGFFEELDLDRYEGYKLISGGYLNARGLFSANTFLREMRADYSRVMFVKCYGDRFDQLPSYYKYFVLLCEYLQSHDYSTGVSFVVDFRDMNITDFVRAISIMDVKKAMDIATEGYSLRIKGIHLLSESKAIDLFVTLLRQILKAKIGQRITCHKDMESLYTVVPKEILPKEYGGNDKTVPELRDDLLSEIRSDKFMKHCKEMNKARTNEQHRLIADFNQEYLGMAGTFRTLTVD